MCSNNYNNVLGTNMNSCNNPNLLGGNNNGNIGNLGSNTTNNNLQENLKNFIGRRITAEFNICGTGCKKTGVLTCVGCNFITLAGNNNTCLLANTDGLNFVTVHNC